MPNYFIIVLSCSLFFLTSTANSQQVCEQTVQSGTHQACFSIDKNRNSGLTEDQRIRNDATHRNGYSFWIKSKINKVQHCDISYATAYSFYDVTDGIDGCAVMRDDFPVRHETVQEQMILAPNQKKQVTNQKSPEFQAAWENRNGDRQPLYCSGSVSVRCTEGCPSGKVFIGGTCQKGCNYKGKLMRSGDHHDYTRVDSDNARRTCSRRTMRVSCGANGSFSEEVLSTRSGILDGSQCVDGCTSQLVGNLRLEKHKIKDVENLFEGTSFNKRCKVDRITHTCEENGKILEERHLLYNGWVNKAGKCVRNKGCAASQGRSFDHGEEFSEFYREVRCIPQRTNGPRGYSIFREYRCSNGAKVRIGTDDGGMTCDGPMDFEFR
ncbi:MAG: hypothetical protein D3920_09825 [Candidatus Electrothrix sp. AW2]|nr:hypothetical protein [Candidatus Electrothrix gigas]